MRLINCKTYHLEEFLGSNIPKYAILSHTWSQDEVTFAEFTTDLESAKHKAGFRKIQFICEQALAEKIEYAWVDTACIDKSSSAELTEAINSMFKWYALSTICYTYLSDVTKENFDDDFPQSRWFSRGWTLQELLAPTELAFFDSEWQALGSKQEHAILLNKITRIDVEALKDNKRHEQGRAAPLGAFCVAKRMAWASKRETTREEDVAYSLLGIFSVNMPLLYGEGPKAFLRLQQEIIKNLDDDSILAWGFQEDRLEDKKPSDWTQYDRSRDWRYENSSTSILARSPMDFANCHGLQYNAESISPFIFTNLGLQIELPLISFPFPNSRRSFDGDPNKKTGSGLWRSSGADGAVGLLTCNTSNASEQLGIVLIPHNADRNMRILKDNPNTRMERAEVVDMGQVRSATVRIKPREAAAAVTSKIIIVESDTAFNARIEKHVYYQIVPQTSKDLRCDFGYRMVAAFISHDYLGRRREGTETWDPENEILVLPADDFVREAFAREEIVFAFQSNDESRYPAFSVIVKDQKVTVRGGIDVTEKDKFAFFDSTAYNAQRSDKKGSENRGLGQEGVILQYEDGTWCKVDVLVNYKDVHLWKIIEVDIDTVYIGKGARR